MANQSNPTEPDNNLSVSQSSPADKTANDKQFDIQAFEATRQIATRQIQRLQELKKELKVYTGQLKDLLENDSDLNQAESEAKEVTQKVKLRKTEIMETSEAKNLKLKITDLKEERFDIEDSLTAHLLDLYQTTGVMELEDPRGEIWEYEFKSKIKPHKRSL